MSGQLSAVRRTWVESPAGDRMEPFFFSPGVQAGGGGAAALYGCLHFGRPASSLGWGALLCAPHLNEYTCSHRAYRHLAERLARSGVDTLRFDVFGYGDSVGDASEVTSLDRWVADVDAAARELRQRTAAVRTVVVGRRLGGSLAALYGVGPGVVIDAMVLWDPVISGVAYLEELEAMHEAFVSAPRGRYLGAMAREDERSGRPPAVAAEYLGQTVAVGLAGDLQRLDLRGLTRAPARAVLLIDTKPRSTGTAAFSSHLRGLGAAVEERRAIDPASWTIGDPLQQVVPQNVLAEITRWLMERVR